MVESSVAAVSLDRHRGGKPHGALTAFIAAVLGLALLIVPGQSVLAADTSPPSAPTGLVLTAPSAAQVTATWSAANDDIGVASYQVFRNGNRVDPGTTITGLQHTFTVDFSTGTQYIQVRAVDGAGNTGNKTAPVTIEDIASPSAPTGLSRTAPSATQVIATWLAANDDIGVASYQVFRNGNRVDPGTTITGLQHTFTVDFSTGTQYIQVRAVDGAGNTGNKTAPVTIDGPSSGDWDPVRARDEAGAVLPYELSTIDAAATIVVDAAGGGQFTSISAAISAANTADVIEVRSGTYRESLGVVNKKIRLRAADGAHPIVLGTDRVEVADFAGGGAIRTEKIWNSNPLWSRDSGLNADDPHYVSLVDANDPQNRADLLPEQVFWVDNNGQWHELTQQRDGNPQSSGTFSYDPLPNGKEFSVHLDDWNAVDHFEITVRQEGLRLIDGADNSAVSGLEFRAFSPRTDNDGWATVAANGTHNDRLYNVELRDIKVTDSAATGISAFYTTNLTLTRVTADNNVVKGLNSGRAHGLRIEFSRFNGNNKDFLRDDNAILAGAKITGNNGDDPNTVVRYNTFADNNATGYWCDLWCENATIVGNYAGDNDKHGIYYEVSEDAVIASNLFVDNSEAGIKVSGSRRVDVIRNTFAGNGEQIHLGTDIRPRTGPGDGNRRPAFPAIIDTSDIEIDGNVFAEAPGAPEPVLFSVGGRYGAGNRNLPSERLASHHENGHALNTNDPNGGFRFEWDNDTEWQTAAQFLPNMGAGSGQLTVRDADPYSAFVGPSSGDWSLTSGSSLGSYSHSQSLPGGAIAEMIGVGSGSSPIGAVLS